MTEAAAKKAAKEFTPTTGQKSNAQKLAKEVAGEKNINPGKGSIIIKPQLCGKYCGTCPHGPYAWHVYNGEWTYIGSVGGGIGTGSVGKKSVSDEEESEEEDENKTRGEWGEEQQPFAGFEVEEFSATVEKTGNNWKVDIGSQEMLTAETYTFNTKTEAVEFLDFMQEEMSEATLERALEQPPVPGGNTFKQALKNAKITAAREGIDVELTESEAKTAGVYEDRKEVKEAVKSGEVKKLDLREGQNASARQDLLEQVEEGTKLKISGKSQPVTVENVSRGRTTGSEEGPVMSIQVDRGAKIGRGQNIDGYGLKYTTKGGDVQSIDTIEILDE